MKLSEAIKIIRSEMDGDTHQAATFIAEKIALADSADTDTTPEMLTWLQSNPFDAEIKKVEDARLNFFGFSIEMIRSMWRNRSR